jgi:hypothetical protein
LERESAAIFRFVCRRGATTPLTGRIRQLKRTDIDWRAGRWIWPWLTGMSITVCSPAIRKRLHNVLPNWIDLLALVAFSLIVFHYALSPSEQPGLLMPGRGPCGRRQVHARAYLDEWAVGYLDQAAGRPVEIERHEQRQGDEHRRDEDGQHAAAHRAQVQAERRQGDGGHEQFQDQNGGRNAVAQAGDAGTLRVEGFVQGLDVEPRRGIGGRLVHRLPGQAPQLPLQARAVRDRLPLNGTLRTGVGDADARVGVVALTYKSDEHGGTITHKPEADYLDDGPEKPVRIWNRTGRRPMLAAGNSNGDTAMLVFTYRPDKPTLRLVIFHDDPEREFDYTTGAEHVLERAAKDGWTLVSIKNDWATVF